MPFPKFNALFELVLELFDVCLVEGGRRLHLAAYQGLLSLQLIALSELADEVQVEGLKLMVFSAHNEEGDYMVLILVGCWYGLALDVVKSCNCDISVFFPLE